MLMHLTRRVNFYVEAVELDGGFFLLKQLGRRPILGRWVNFYVDASEG